jgi:hypothetical protein
VLPLGQIIACPHACIQFTSVFKLRRPLEFARVTALRIARARLIEVSRARGTKIDSAATFAARRQN